MAAVAGAEFVVELYASAEVNAWAEAESPTGTETASDVLFADDIGTVTIFSFVGMKLDRKGSVWFAGEVRK